MQTVITEDGRLLVYEEAVACVAGIAALGCPGVAGLAGRGLPAEIAGMLGRDGPGRGVAVALEDSECRVTLNLVVQYGTRIPEMAEEVVRRVRAAVELATGISVVSTEVRVQGVRPPAVEGVPHPPDGQA